MEHQTLAVGCRVTFSKTVGESDIYLFAGITGDLSPNHVDREFMKKTAYGRRIAHGSLLVGSMSTASTMILQNYPAAAADMTPVSLGYDRIRFLKPVFINDTITVHYQIEAVDSGVPEAIMYNHEGYVAEASADNVFIVKRGVIYAPPAEAGALPGITRGIIIKLAGRENIQVVEKNLTRFDLYVADEFFLTGTGAEIIGIIEIDKRVIGNGRPGPITKLLRSKFFEYAHGKEKG